MEPLFFLTSRRTRRFDWPYRSSATSRNRASTWVFLLASCMRQSSRSCSRVHRSLSRPSTTPRNDLSSVAVFDKTSLTRSPCRSPSTCKTTSGRTGELRRFPADVGGTDSVHPFAQPFVQILCCDRRYSWPHREVRRDPSTRCRSRRGMPF